MKTTEIRHRDDRSILVPRFDRGIRTWVEVMPEYTEDHPIRFEGGFDLSQHTMRWGSSYWHDGQHAWQRLTTESIVTSMCRPTSGTDVASYLFRWDEKTGQWDRVDVEYKHLAIAG